MRPRYQVCRPEWCGVSSSHAFHCCWCGGSAGRYDACSYCAFDQSEAPRAHWGGLDAVLMPVAEADKSMVPLYQCNLCGITATSIDHLDAHYRCGCFVIKCLPLRACSAIYLYDSLLPSCQPFACLACVWVMSEQLSCTSRGLKHQKRIANLEMKGAQGNNSPLPKAENAPSGPGTYPGGIFACSICKLACSSMDNLQTHCMVRP